MPLFLYADGKDPVGEGRRWQGRKEGIAGATSE